MKKYFTEEQLEAQLKKYGKSTISETALNKAEKISSLLGEQIDNFKTIVNIVKNHFKGIYEINSVTLILLIGAIIYVISPMDLIPDFIPGVGYLDDIAVVGLAIKMCSVAIKGYLVWESTKVVVDGVFYEVIEHNVTKQISKINDAINTRYSNLWKQLLIEIVFFASIIATKIYFPPLPAKGLCYTFIVLRGGYSVFKICKVTHKLALQLHFYEVSQFFTYFKMTKDFHQALVLDMRNFYDYHYKKSLNPNMQHLHQIGVVVKLTPDNEAIFDRICKSIFENVPIMLKRECVILVVFFVLYMIVIAILRRAAIGVV